MTNRLDVIDPVLLRYGRLAVKNEKEIIDAALVKSADELLSDRKYNNNKIGF